jgi:hypothetical protein
MLCKFILIYNTCLFLAHLAKGHVSFCHHLASIVRRKLSHLNLLLWNHWTKLNQTWQGWSLGGSLSKLCLTASPPFKMAAVTKNRHFFNCPLLLYYKSKWAQIVTAATWQWVVQHIFQVFLWNFSFSRFIQIMQIRHILFKDHI